jgi:predicted unusual protein kinase regulating ubiquinone biosynthesis (AarF/ABC1/UbiB family)
LLLQPQDRLPGKSAQTLPQDLPQWGLPKKKLQPDRTADIKTQKSIAALVASLGALKGPVVKMAQMLAMVPGLLPESYSTALLSLCTQSPPMHWPMVLRRMRQELGANWESYFLHFEKTPTAAASLGQIHRAQLPDSSPLAIKIQYPAMLQAVQGDIGLFKAIVGFLAPSEKALDLTSFSSEWEARLLEELDYACEANHMHRWSVLFQSQPHIAIARVVPHLSTSKVLVMSWLEGRSMQEAFEQPDAVRHRLGKEIFLAWYTPFYQAAMIHGDPHLGNMGWSETHLNLFDFGCVRIFSPHFVQAFCHLYTGFLNDDAVLVCSAYAQLGFNPINEPIAQALNIWAKFLLAPFLIDQECTLDYVSSPEQARDNLIHLYQTLQSHGGTQPPAEFLIFDRVAVILGSLLVRLGAKANWYQLMRSLVESFSLENCTRTQKQLLDMSLNDGNLK